MNNQIQDLKNQIANEQQRHTKTMQNLNNRLEALQNSEREKRERDKRSKQIQTGYQNTHKSLTTFAPRYENNENIINGLREYLFEQSV